MFALRLSRTALRSAAPQRALSTLNPNLYTATSTVTGSRAQGKAVTNEGNLELKMQMPKQVTFFFFSHPLLCLATACIRREARHRPRARFFIQGEL